MTRVWSNDRGKKEQEKGMKRVIRDSMVHGIMEQAQYARYLSKDFSIS